MKSTSKLLLWAGLSIGLTVSASASTCPPREPGTYPWSTNGTMPGDKWAWVYLELDEKARPKRCLMGESNIHDSDMRFFICRVAKEDWRPATPEDARTFASTTQKRFFILRGPDHAKKMREARKRYFAEHPDERPDCYPEG
jgi:hypothetical protein